MVELLLLLFNILIGLIGGTFAGLFPGVHSNTISQLFRYLNIDPLYLPAAIISASSADTIISLIPAIFLFVPEQSSFISVLPGQRMVKAGKGLFAIYTCCLSAFFSLFVLLFVLPISFFLIPILYEAIRPFLGSILIFLSFLFIINEKKLSKIAKAAFVFLLAGSFGFITLNNALLKEPLFTSFIGLFAISNLLLTMKNPKIPYQKNISKGTKFINSILDSTFILIIIVGVFLGALSDLFPAIGSSGQMATFGSMLAVGSPARFLALTTSISVSHIASSLVTLHTLGKTRVGATAIIKEEAGIPDFKTLLIYLIIAFITLSISIAILWKITIPFVRVLRSIDIRYLNILLLFYLISAIFLIDGLMGLAIAGIAASIGILPPLFNVRRTHLMGFLLIPTILYLVFL